MVGVPSSFGPGSAVITGAGDFGAMRPASRAVEPPRAATSDFSSTAKSVGAPRARGRNAPSRCMQAVTHDAVTAAVRDLGVVAQ